MVAALREDGTATLKHLQRDGGQVFLVPANPYYPTLPGDNITILGKVVGVIACSPEEPETMERGACPPPGKPTARREESSKESQAQDFSRSS